MMDGGRVMRVLCFGVQRVILTGVLIMVLGSVGLCSGGAVHPILPQGDLESPGAGIYLAELQSESRALVLAQADGTLPPSIDLEQAADMPGDMKRKSPLKAFIYSAVLPGAGQYYVGSKWKAAIFLGIEVAAWTGHISFHSKGEDLTADFENFANTHWSENSYSDFLELNWGVRDDDLISSFTHHLPDTKTQQYYEMIGKYDQFVFGWDDVDLPPDAQNTPYAHSSNRLDYMDMRLDANNAYDRANALVVAAMVNHIVSGIEAALSARRHNNKVDQFTDRVSVRAVTACLDNRYFPMLTMTYSF
jgi:hypothetical protein